VVRDDQGARRAAVRRGSPGSIGSAPPHGVMRLAMDGVSAS
jgi:hypothetical protein